MKAQPTERGRVVVSTQGHDAGRWHVVVSVLDARYVLICDGEARKLAKPKKKQAKHLRALPLTLPVEGKGACGGPIADSDIRAELRAARNAYETRTGSAPTRARPEKDKEEGALVQE